MRKQLLPQTNCYKANLHSHSTASDGVRTPQELKSSYKARGYSIFAYTDHNVLIDRSDLNDEDFLTITSVEVDVTENFPDKSWRKLKSCHLNLYAKDAHNELNPFCEEGGDTQKTAPHFRSEYAPEKIRQMIKTAKDSGFLVCYNHPTWSLETLLDYIHYEDIFAMEVYNHGTYSAGYNEYNAQRYDELLKMGKMIYPIAADDNHNRKGDEGSFGGFTMIYAPALEYDCVINALEEGHFYASCGPTIKSLYIENGKAHIECSPVKEIHMRNKYRFEPHVRGDNLTCASFDLDEDYGYIRFEIIDENGNGANTRAYSQEVLM